jgi:hypothetical protein
LAISGLLNVQRGDRHLRRRPPQDAGGPMPPACETRICQAEMKAPRSRTRCA